MNKILPFSIIIMLLGYGLCWATIINVPADYPTIQQGIDASADGDTVLVQPGTYYENINFNGHNIVLGSQFLTTGDTSYISTTVIDGDSAGPVVTFSSSQDSGPAIIGFTIQHGFAPNGGGILCDSSSSLISYNNIVENYYRYRGGGIYCDNSYSIIENNNIGNNVGGNHGGGIYCNNSDPTIKYNSIKVNSAGSSGGGICCHYSSPTIFSNNICDNSAGSIGGGILCGFYSNPTIINNTISGNSANGEGGGIRCALLSTPTIRRNEIFGNIAVQGGGVAFVVGSDERFVVSENIIYNNVADIANGGGIYCEMSAPIFLNNKITNNTANNFGGGICCYNSNLTIINNTLSRNVANQSGGGIYSTNLSMNIINSVVWADSAVIEGNEIFLWGDSLIVNYSNIQGGWPGIGNIDVDPLFRDPVNGDFHLMSIACGDSADSPCIDAGDPNILDSLLDCSWGLGGLRSDMGAYGGADSLITAILENQIPTPSRFMLMQNYPNPFIARTAGCRIDHL
jgi:predicted outer membrane repeat protein